MKCYWIESNGSLANDMMTEIVSSVIAAGAVLKQHQLEEEQRRLQREQEERVRAEHRRLRELENKRWENFREAASNWRETESLKTFLSELKKSSQTDFNREVDGRSISEWVEWAEGRINEIDPLAGDVGQVFQISKIR